ncbi:MAG: cobalamin-binding protein [Anaerolineales bacterium]|nr:MAG: cobalamin-binding protein [Anaerolineales bacterium]
MDNTDLRATLITAISNLQEKLALTMVRERISRGDDPIKIIEDCREGMRQVGMRYEAGEYFLAGLIMAGEIFRQTMELLQPVIKHQISKQATGRILLGTVKGDIHDLGKNIVNMLLGCHSFAVHDLGVDVTPEVFAEQVVIVKPHIIGLSGLLTSSYDSMLETIDHLRASVYQGPIIVGGGQLTDEVCQYVGADYWCNDAVTGVELCKRLISEETAKT